MNLLKKILPHKRKGNGFLVVEIGLGRVNAGFFRSGERPHLAAVGRKSFSSYENIFEAVLEAVDALAAISKDVPNKAILGTTNGILRTTTTIAKYTRPVPEDPISADEVSKVLEKISNSVSAGKLEVFFSTIASAKLDAATVTNPVGLKAREAALACFIALKAPDELVVFDQLIEELELKVNKVMPSSFAVSRVLLKNNLNDALILRVGKEKSEAALLSEGHIFEILSFDLGMNGAGYLAIGLEAVISLLEKEKRPDTIWLYPDEDEIDLSMIVEKLNNFPWQERLGYEQPPTVTSDNIITEVPIADTGLFALATEYLEG